MSKSILVIDTPESCWVCDLENGHHCVCTARYIENDEFETMPDWCPLKELPKKKKYDNKVSISKQHTSDYRNGYNACIDEILKG